MLVELTIAREIIRNKLEEPFRYYLLLREHVSHRAGYIPPTLDIGFGGSKSTEKRILKRLQQLSFIERGDGAGIKIKSITSIKTNLDAYGKLSMDIPVSVLKDKRVFKATLVQMAVHNKIVRMNFASGRNKKSLKKRRDELGVGVLCQKTVAKDLNLSQSTISRWTKDLKRTLTTNNALGFRVIGSDKTKSYWEFVEYVKDRTTLALEATNIPLKDHYSILESVIGRIRVVQNAGRYVFAVQDMYQYDFSDIQLKKRRSESGGNKPDIKPWVDTFSGCGRFRADNFFQGADLNAELQYQASYLTASL